MFATVTGWIILGVFCGCIARWLMNRENDGLPMNIGIGLVGAVIGGWLFIAFAASGATGFNFWSLLVAVAGAGVCLAVWHALRHSTARA